MRFLLLFLAFTAAQAADYQLKATPGTVAWGYYWSAAKPVLRIKSGDTVEIQTLMTNSPERAGRRRSQAGRYRAGVEGHLRRSEGQGSGRPHPDRPDLHRGRRTGRHAGSPHSRDPVAMPYAYNGFSPQRGVLPAEDFEQAAPRSSRSILQRNVAQVRRQYRNPAAPLFRQHGSGAATKPRGA